MNVQHAQSTAASNSSAVAAGPVIYGKREVGAALPVNEPVNHPPESSAGTSMLVTKSVTNPLFSSLTSGVNGEDLKALEQRSGGRYLGQSKTLNNHCPQRAAELVYLQLLADLQLAKFDRSTAFRDKFAKVFAEACPNEKPRWMSYFVRCQARLALKVDRNFSVVCLATVSAHTKTARAKTC